jgi:predicted carbohydrate-binding protein with CBM5 and CBM33 domain
MHLRTRLSLLAAGILLAPLLAVLITPSPASAHGWITSPPSRQDQCATGVVANCGDVQYEPQSVEAPKGARSCSGGSRFSVLNDDGKGWRVTSIGSTATFTWRFTAMHRTTNWEYYVDGTLRQTVNGNAQQPPATVSHTISGLPGGRHKILAIWNIYDTGNAFYSCVDVNVGGGGGGNPPPPPPPVADRARRPGRRPPPTRAVRRCPTTATTGVRSGGRRARRRVPQVSGACGRTSAPAEAC